MAAQPEVGGSSAALWGQPQDPAPHTHIDLAEDDVNDAANHYEEVKDIPGVPEVALSEKSQRRGVNIQGLGHGGNRCRSTEEEVPESSSVILGQGGPEGW